MLGADERGVTISFDGALVITVSTATLFSLTRSRGCLLRLLGRHPRDTVGRFHSCVTTHRGRPLSVNTNCPLVGTLVGLGRCYRSSAMRLPSVRTPLIRIIVISGDDPSANVRMLGTVQRRKLGVSQSTFVSNDPISPCVGSFGISLFLAAGHRSTRRITSTGVYTYTVLSTAPIGACGLSAGRLHVTFSNSTILFSSSNRLLCGRGKLHTFRSHRTRVHSLPVRGKPCTRLLVGLSGLRRHLPTNLRCSPVGVTLIATHGTPTSLQTVGALQR